MPWRWKKSPLFIAVLWNQFMINSCRKMNNKVWLKPVTINTPSSTQYYYLLLRPPNSVVINSPAHLQECSLLRSTSRSKLGKKTSTLVILPPPFFPIHPYQTIYHISPSVMGRLWWVAQCAICVSSPSQQVLLQTKVVWYMRVIPVTEFVWFMPS